MAMEITVLCYCQTAYKQQKSHSWHPLLPLVRSLFPLLFSTALQECWEKNVASVPSPLNLLLPDTSVPLFLGLSSIMHAWASSPFKVNSKKPWFSGTAKLINSVFCWYIKNTSLSTTAYFYCLRYVNITEVFCLWFTVQMTNHHNDYLLSGYTDWTVVMQFILSLFGTFYDYLLTMQWQLAENYPFAKAKNTQQSSKTLWIHWKSSLLRNLLYCNPERFFCCYYPFLLARSPLQPSMCLENITYFRQLGYHLALQAPPLPCAQQDHSFPSQAQHTSHHAG